MSEAGQILEQRPLGWVLQCHVTYLLLYASLYLARLPAKWICVTPAGIEIYPVHIFFSFLHHWYSFLSIGGPAVKLSAHYDRDN